MVNGHLQHRLPNTANVSLPNIESNTLLEALGDVLAASTGSACNSGNNKPSHVLSAMGLSDERIRSAIRFSVGRSTTPAHVDDLTVAMRKCIKVLAH